MHLKNFNVRVVIIVFSILLLDGIPAYGSHAWELLHLGGTKLIGEALWFSNNNRGHLIIGDSIYYSSDGGSTWHKQFITEVKTLGTSIKFKIRSQLRDVYFFNENIGWAVGTDGLILYTSNGGVTWIKQQSGVELEQFGGVPIDIGLNSVFFIDQYTGWVVGNNVILHTENGGSTWERQYFGTKHGLLKVFFVDKNNGWAVGYNGKILYTSTGGKKRFGFWGGWVEQKSSTGVHLYGLNFIDRYTGWATGSDEVLHTDDGGQTWHIQAKGLAKTLRAVYFINKNEGWVGGGKTILFTANGGRAWTVQTSGDFSIVDFHFIDENHGWAVGGKGTILRYRGDNPTGK